MKKHNTNEQNKRNKVSNDLSYALPVESGSKIQDLGVILALLKSQDKDGFYHLQSMEQALDLIPEPLMGKTKGYLNKKMVDIEKCLDPMSLQQERWELVKSIFRTFHAPNTGFPELLESKYKPVLTGEQELAIIENKKSRDGVRKSYQTITLANGEKKVIEHDIVKPTVSNFRNGYFNKIKKKIVTWTNEL